MRLRPNSETYTLYENRYFRLEFLKCCPYENEGFAFISDRYTIKFTDTVYETKMKTEFWKVNSNMETGISIWHI